MWEPQNRVLEGYIPNPANLQGDPRNSLLLKSTFHWANCTEGFLLALCSLRHFRVGSLGRHHPFHHAPQGGGLWSTDGIPHAEHEKPGGARLVDFTGPMGGDGEGAEEGHQSLPLPRPQNLLTFWLYQDAMVNQIAKGGELK